MKDFHKNRYVTVVAGIIFVLAVTYSAFNIGYREGVKKPQTLTIKGVSNIESGKEVAADFSLFWQVWQIVKNKYVNIDKISDQDLVYGAASGILSALKDPNSNFFPPSDAKKFTEDISGEFSGIGAEIGIKNDQLVVIAPLKGTPAEKAGLKSGDKILKINDKTTLSLTVEEAVKLIRGLKGTTVTLAILRNDWSSPKDFAIKRDTIQVPTLDFEMKNKDIAYIHLYNFYDKAPFQFYQAAFKIAANNSKGLILDLRDNPGGYLEVGIDLAGWFLKPDQVVVKEEFHNQPEQIFKSRGPGLFKDLPVVILINQGSASASEILAGALRDNRNIKLIGKKSFGKGTVQELQELQDGSLLKVTIAHWVMPKGLLIDKNGLTPDYEVDLKEEDVKARKDPQLDKALEMIKTEVKAHANSLPNFQVKAQSQ